MVKPRSRRVTLRRRSPFKRRLRGYRVNPGLAEYLMNPRRRHRGHRRRHAYRHNPAGGVVQAMTGVFDFRFLKQGAVATAGAVVTLTVANHALIFLTPYVPGTMQIGMIGTVTKAAVRAGTAYVLDRYVVGKISSDHMSFRVGAAIAIVGSALLELMGKQFILGLGDGAQTLTSFAPAGIGSYVEHVSSRAGTASYVRSMRGGSGGGIGSLDGIGNEAHQRLYGTN